MECLYGNNHNDMHIYRYYSYLTEAKSQKRIRRLILYWKNPYCPNLVLSESHRSHIDYKLYSTEQRAVYSTLAHYLFIVMKVQ